MVVLLLLWLVRAAHISLHISNPTFAVVGLTTVLTIVVLMLSLPLPPAAAVYCRCLDVPRRAVPPASALASQGFGGHNGVVAFRPLEA